MLLSSRAAVRLTLLALCGLVGCPSGESRLIPPVPTPEVSPVPAQPVVFVAEARDPNLGTNGGCVSAYRVGTDGSLEGCPFASAPVVNPRRLLRHPNPDIQVLYVAGANQIFAFDVSSNALFQDDQSTGCTRPAPGCPPERRLKLLAVPVPVPTPSPGEPSSTPIEPPCAMGGLTAPCATEPRPGANPFDMTIAAAADQDDGDAQSDATSYVLYVSEAGGGENLDTQTRLAAYPLLPTGGLPANASSQVQDIDSLRFESAAALPTLNSVFIADTGTSVINRYLLLSNGDLPQSPTSPTPIGPTPTPSPTPAPSPTASPTPTVAPSPVRAFGPGRMQLVTLPPKPPANRACPTPMPGPLTLLYAVQQSQNRMSVYPVTTPTPPPAESDPTPTPTQFPLPLASIPKDPTKESNTRGFYNAILIDPCVTHIYGAAFSNGQIDFYTLDDLGEFVLDSEGATFADTSQYPTGLAWLDYNSGCSVLVSLGGSNRVDTYAVQGGCLGGTLLERPTSSTQPIDGTFPADVAVAYPRPTAIPTPTTE